MSQAVKFHFSSEWPLCGNKDFCVYGAGLGDGWILRCASTRACKAAVKLGLFSHGGVELPPPWEQGGSGYKFSSLHELREATQILKQIDPQINTLIRKACSTTDQRYQFIPEGTKGWKCSIDKGHPLYLIENDQGHPIRYLLYAFLQKITDQGYPIRYLLQNLQVIAPSRSKAMYKIENEIEKITREHPMLADYRRPDYTQS